MPELPEVETIRRSLLHNVGAHISQVEVRRASIIRRQDYVLEDISRLAITDVARRGKYLVLNLEKSLYIIVHLGMSGRFYMLDEDAPVKAPHVHLIIHLDNERQLVYEDARRFGGVWFTVDPQSIFQHMGVEPLSLEFTSQYLADIIQNRKIAIKTLLLNQNLISGIGNIYADEALFAARIKPSREARSLSPKEIKRLRLAIIEVLEHSIAERGTTFRDFRDGYNRSGDFQHHLKVYGKTDQPCSVCGQLIKKVRIGGRSSHYCEKCQK